MGAGFFQQLKILCYRNILLKIRKARELSQEIITPIFFILILAILRLLVVPKTKPATGSFPSYPLLRSDFIVNSSQHILVSPNDTGTVQFMDDVLQILQSTGKNLSYKTFSTAGELEDYYKRNSASVSSAIEIASLMTSDVNITIRMPFGTVPNDFSADSKTDLDKCRKTLDGLSREDCPANEFLYSGFASLQLATATVATKMFKTPSFTVPDIQVEMLPKPAYEPSVLFLQIISAIYYVVAFSPLLNFLTVALVTEKEKKTRETMKIMGLRDSVFWLSWWAVYAIIILIVSIAAVILTVAISFFEHSNLGLFFILLMLYGLSIVSLSFVFTPFFSKARTAGGLASFSTILVSALYLVIPLTKDPLTGLSSIPPYGQWLLCLLSPLAFSLAIDQSLFLDISGVGLTTETVARGQFPVAYSMIMLAVDTVLYALIAAYLDNVIPQEYGQQKVPYFFLLPSYWFPKEREVKTNLSDDDVNLGNEDVEPVPAELQDKKVIRIKNLYKRYRSKKGIIVAIPDLSLDIYEGQITCLLGHNGAGKTTLINMLTGMGEPTKGGASVYGLDISSAGDMSQLRQLFGMCPQQNVMFENLTCEENLRVFANIKGVAPAKVDEEINDVLEQVNLMEKKRAYAEKLSGGQKRKLCVAMALIGDPKVLFLDEPTSGLDPYSRRHLWSLLKSKRPGRVIVLTTHFMDEADILADRKAVINKGNLKCCGSSLFLKNRFGVGYHLDMVVEPSCDKGQITEVVRSKIPGAGEGRSHGQELSYTLPLDEAEKFSELFAVLGSPEGGPETERLGIQSYGVSMTSLEEVFLKLEGKKIMLEGAEEKKPGMSVTNPLFDSTADSDVSLSRIPVNGMENGRSAPNRENMESIDTILSRTHIITEEGPLLRHRLKALIKIRFLLAFRNAIAVYFRVFMPLMYIILGVVLVKVVNFGENNPESRSTNISPSMSTLPYVNSTGHQVTDFVDHMTRSGFFNAVEVASSDDFAKFKPQWALDVFTLDTGAGGGVENSNLTLFYNDTYEYSVLVSLWSTLNAMFSSPNTTLGKELRFYSRPLPPLTKSHQTDWGSFLMVQFLGMALCLIPSGFLVEAVRDRQCKAKSQLRVFGIGPSLYWGSIFILDYLQYLFPVVIAIIAMAAAQLNSLQSGGAFLAIILLFLLYMPMNMLLAYCISFMFDSHETALMAAPNLLIMAGYLPFLPVSLVDSTNPDVSYYIHMVACIIDPPYIVFGGLHYIYRLYRYATQDLVTGVTNIPFGSYFEWSSNIPLPILMAALYIGPLILLMRYLDLRSTGGDPRDLFHCNKHVNSSIVPARNDDAILNEDEDVVAERKKIQQIDPSKPVIIVNGLRKEFTETGTSGKKCWQREKCETTKLAVRNNSFTVMPGEVFGLLGPNGAGKTTTLNMVIAEVAPSCGQVTVGGFEIRSSLSKAFQLMGYCPQHDPLWDTITLSEHLNCFAAIKGVALSDIHTIEDYFLKSLEIDEHKNKKAKELSGGTKRKLSYILSMLGDLKIVLLDEPSTGMDPKAKRFLWDTITASFTSERRGAILTTHYMEEADALCSRIAIMVNGEMKCLGSSTHLKNKYGSGYTLELKLRLGDHDLDTRHAEVEGQIRQLFQDASLSEKFGERAIYKVPRNSGLSLAKAFIALEEMKRTLGVEEYSFSQATLEQVFLDFARKQVEEKEDPVEEKVQQNGNPSSQPSYRPIEVA